MKDCFATLAATTLLLMLVAAGSGRSEPADSLPGWLLLWSDEFDGPAGQAPDPTRWDYDIGTDWGNAQLEYDTDRRENSALDGNGNLAIIAREESYMGRPYTSARLVTRDRYEPTYGRVEARIKLPVGQGIWPAFWLLGANIDSIGWPQCGEIDIMEYRGQQPNVILGSMHGPGYSGGAAISEDYTLIGGRFDTAFYTFAVEWEEDEVRWYLDDSLYHSVTPSDLAPNEWVFDHSFYIILNIAVGGNFVGAPDGSTVFPQTMLIDYVRVYQRGPDDTEDEAVVGDTTMATGRWISIDIPLAVLDSLISREHIGQVVISGDPQTVYVDNIFFHKPPTIPAAPAPVPEYAAGDVVSLYSDAYTDVFVDTWSADWDNADVVDTLAGNDNVKRYDNLVFAGIETTSSPLDVSGMTHFRVDVWTPDPTGLPVQFRIKLVDFGADGFWSPAVDDVEHELAFDASTAPALTSGQWVTFDIPLSAFTGLTTTEHIAQVILSGDVSTVFVDNVLFHR